MFKTRLISGIVLVAAMFLALRPGGIVSFAAFGAIALVGTFEFYRAVRLTGPLFYIGLAASAVWYYIAYAVPQAAVGYLAIVLVIMLLPYVIMYPEISTENGALAYFGFIYTAVLLSTIPLARTQLGGYYVLLIFFAAWGADTCAYVVGMLFGKHKMAPVLSPKKSVEGAAGGVAGAVLLALIFAWITKGPAVIYAAVCFFGSQLSMVGDLAASAIKRTHDIKDFGWCIPGHGGVLDRFDSLLFTGPAVYFLALLFTGF